MNKTLRESALNASVVRINGESWYVFSIYEDEGEITFTLAKPHLLRFSGDLSATVEDQDLSELLESGATLEFIPLDLNDMYTVSTV